MSYGEFLLYNVYTRMSTCNSMSTYDMRVCNMLYVDIRMSTYNMSYVDIRMSTYNMLHTRKYVDIRIVCLRVTVCLRMTCYT